RLQIDGCRQIDAIKLLKLVPESRIDLRLGGLRFEHVHVANALDLLQPHWQKHERRIEALGRLGLEVRPPQKAKDEPQLGEAELSLIAAGVVANRVELARQINRLLEAEILVERQRRARGEYFLQRLVRGQDLLWPDCIHIESERHGRPGQVHRLIRRPKMQQAIPPRYIEQAAAQAGKDG